MVVALPGSHRRWTSSLRVRLGLALLIWAAGLFAARATGQPTNPEAGEVITQHTDYWKDGVRDEARPIRMEMTVLTYDPSWGGAWVMVDGVPGYIPTRGAELPIRPGDRVLVEGTVVPNLGFSPDQLRFTFLERDVALIPYRRSHA